MCGLEAIVNVYKYCCHKTYRYETEKNKNVEKSKKSAKIREKKEIKNN